MGAGVRSVSEWRSFLRTFLQFCQSSRRKRCLAAMAAALVFFYGILFTVVFGIAGIVGLGIGGVADGNVLRGAAVGCCGGGMAGGLVVGIVLLQNLAGNAGRGTLQVAVGLGLSLPWLLGGTAIARALSASPGANRPVTS